MSAVLIFFIRVYQNAISPLFGGNCRFAPTCSQYGIEAIREWGPWTGTWLGLKRIAKCHPWGSHGYDPVPRKTPSSSERDADSDAEMASTTQRKSKHQIRNGESAASP